MKIIKMGKVKRKKVKAIKMVKEDPDAYLEGIMKRKDKRVADHQKQTPVKKKIRVVLDTPPSPAETAAAAALEAEKKAMAHSPDMSVSGVLRDPPSGPDSYRALSHAARRAKGKWWKKRKRLLMGDAGSMSTRCGECMQPVTKGEKYRQGDGVSAHESCMKSLLRGGDPAHVLDIVKKNEGKESSGVSVGRFLIDTIARHNPNVAHVREGIRKLKHVDLVDRLAIIYCHILGLSGTERI